QMENYIQPGIRKLTLSIGAISIMSMDLIRLCLIKILKSHLGTREILWGCMKRIRAIKCMFGMINLDRDGWLSNIREPLQIRQHVEDTMNWTLQLKINAPVK